ncbi:MAG TPA: hypothetical protein VFG63_01540 [Nocardioidaceae bacterium]|nr:hypothetical protein [Nocardioidaceae bacterium]
MLRQQTGLRRGRQVDTVEAGLVGACDGELGVGQILDALAALLQRDPAEVRGAHLTSVRELVEDGFLAPRRYRVCASPSSQEHNTRGIEDKHGQ